MELEYKNILVPVDGSKESHRAVEQGVYLAKLSGAEIILMTVVTPEKSTDQAEDVGELKKKGYDCLSEVIHDIPKEMSVTPLVKIGTPADTIIEAAESEKADLVIMGSRGLGPFETMVMGSVSNALVQKCTQCPVMIVR